MAVNDVQRSVLSYIAHFGLTAYESKDLDTKNPPIREIRPIEWEDFQ